ncbi:MAG: acetyltransferase [Desulfobacteraceae bacterium]|jgi:phosphonate metabolism protein (transferase hexapeptide repeat family)|nr:MAG: acetyltransferase [Desulfobacteraceae bacterium]
MSIEILTLKTAAAADGSEPQIDPSAVVKDSGIGLYTDIGPNWTVIESSLGDYSYLAGSDGTVIYTDTGRFSSIASHVSINPGDHPMERVTQHHCTYRRKRYGFSDTDDETLFDSRRRRRCRIGHDVWIGTAAKIMAGVEIGTGAVIGAGAVVTRDVRPYQVVAGVPARPLRMRFERKIVDRLLKIAWWDWDRATLEERFEDFSDLGRFIEKYA